MFLMLGGEETVHQTVFPSCTKRDSVVLFVVPTNKKRLNLSSLIHNITCLFHPGQSLLSNECMVWDLLCM